jgi:hypothetical protein
VMDRNSMRLGLRTTGQSVGLRLLRATKRPRGSNGAPIGALPDRTPRGTLRPPRRATRETLLCVTLLLNAAATSIFFSASFRDGRGGPLKIDTADGTFLPTDDRSFQRETRRDAERRGFCTNVQRKRPRGRPKGV